MGKIYCIMVLKENTKSLIRDSSEIYRLDAIESLINLINYEFFEIKSWNELDKTEKSLITEDQFNCLFTN